MYRSASTLQFQITCRLVKEFQIGQQIGWIDALRFPDVRDRYAASTTLNIIKVHQWTEAIATEFAHQNALGIYSFRDIRDVYASYMKQRDKSFDYFWQDGLIEACLDNYKAWTSLPHVLVSHYETIIRDVPTEVKRIAQHLGLSIAQAQCAAIADDYSIQHQRDRMQAFRQQLLNTDRNSNDHRELVDYHDESTLLHINHVDSGRPGRWKDDLSLDEADAIAQRVQHWCQAHSYSPTLFLNDLQLQHSTTAL